MDQHVLVELEVDGGTVACRFERTGNALAIAEFRATPTAGTSVERTTWLLNAPINRWFRMARAEAQSKVHAYETENPEQHIGRLHPELGSGLRGNAARRRDSLIRLAELAREYKAAEAAGHRNPAAVVAAARGVSAATVRSWLYRARREGLAAASDHLNASANTERTDSC